MKYKLDVLVLNIPLIFSLNLFALFGIFDQVAWAKVEIPEFLEKWSISPRDAAFEIPQKKNYRPRHIFSQDQLSRGDFVEQKNSLRQRICNMSGDESCLENISTFELFTDQYDLKQFVGGTLETDINKLDLYKVGAPTVQPWSGSYWTQNEGGIGVRYADKNFPHADSFMTNFKYYLKNYVKGTDHRSNLSLLSPAEKYDLMMEDKDWSLTYYSWAVPRRNYQLTGKVEDWMGICHGWAAAAIGVPEPTKSFTVALPSLKNTVKIYPDDVKALVSQLWANARLNSIYLGGRCDKKKPETDSNGRLIDKDCFDTNPGTWHLALLNWTGISKKSFVFDSTYDYEVWNQPVSSYKFKYFNPNIKEITDNLKSAIIPYSEFKNDPYQKYRNSKTKSIVGVELILSYIDETEPAPVDQIFPNKNKIIDVTYYYDLEIDSNGNIIGGEWYQLAHPDMIWRPTKTRPVAKNEPENSIWDGLVPPSLDLRNLSKKTVELNQPLSAVVDRWIQKTKRDW